MSKQHPIFNEEPAPANEPPALLKLLYYGLKLRVVLPGLIVVGGVAVLVFIVIIPEIVKFGVVIAPVVIALAGIMYWQEAKHKR